MLDVIDTGHDEPLPLPLLEELPPELLPELLLDEPLPEELLPPPAPLPLPLLVPDPLPLDEPELLLLPLLPPLPAPLLLEDPLLLDVPLLLDSLLLDEPLDPLLLPLPDVLLLLPLLPSPPSGDSPVASPACPWAQAQAKPDSMAKQTTKRFMEKDLVLKELKRPPTPAFRPRSTAPPATEDPCHLIPQF